MLNVLLALPAFLVSLCLVLMAMDAQGYVRHMDSGDQAGFAMGEFFLISYLIPMTAATMVGVVHWWSRREKAGEPARPWIVWVGFYALSGICALFFVLATTAWTLQETREYLQTAGFDVAALSGNVSWICVRATFATLLLAVSWVTAHRSGTVAPKLVRGSAWVMLVSLLMHVAVSVGSAYRQATEPNGGGEPLTHAGGMLLVHAPTLFSMAILFGLVWWMPKPTPSLTMETTSPSGAPG
jgi:hypothetical protein